MISNCPVCQAKFKQPRPTRPNMYCSKKCKDKRSKANVDAKNGIKRNVSVTSNCENCGLSYTYIKSNAPRKYCSKACGYASTLELQRKRNSQKFKPHRNTTVKPKPDAIDYRDSDAFKAFSQDILTAITSITADNRKEAEAFAEAVKEPKESVEVTPTCLSEIRRYFGNKIHNNFDYWFFDAIESISNHLCPTQLSRRDKYLPADQVRVHISKLWTQNLTPLPPALKDTPLLESIYRRRQERST